MTKYCSHLFCVNVAEPDRYGFSFSYKQCFSCKIILSFTGNIQGFLYFGNTLTSLWMGWVFICGLPFIKESSFWAVTGKLLWLQNPKLLRQYVPGFLLLVCSLFPLSNACSHHCVYLSKLNCEVLLEASFSFCSRQSHRSSQLSR